MKGVVLDAKFFDRVFKLPLITVNIVHYNCRMTFSQTLKAAIFKVVAYPRLHGSVGTIVNSS